MRNKLKLKNIIALLLIVFLIIPCVTTVYADDKELIDNYNPTDAELKAWSGTNSLPTDSGAVSDITKNYKNAIPTLAESSGKSVEDFLKLSKEDKIKAIKKGKEEVQNKSPLTPDELFETLTPCKIHMSTDSDCTLTSASLLAYNSMCLDEATQKPAGTYGRNECDVGLDAGAFVSAHGDPSFGSADSATYGVSGTGTYSASVIVGTKNKLFLQMNSKEFAECVKQLWNDGYYCILAVNYRLDTTGDIGTYGESGEVFPDTLNTSEGEAFSFLQKYFKPAHYYSNSAQCEVDDYTPNGAHGTYNGEAIYFTSTHWVYLLGVADDGETYYVDSVGTKLAKIGEGNRYVPTFMLAYKSDKNSPKKIAGGVTMSADLEAGASAGTIDPDNPDATTFTVGSNTYYSESDLSSFAKLDEINIEELFLFGASRENLTQNEAYALTQWEQQRNKMLEENSLTKLIRVSLMFIGIILSVYFILLYLAYWLDRINNIIEIRFLELLTLKKLTVSYDETDCTYGNKGGDKLKTVNHKAILKICIIGEFLATVLITGLVFKFIMWAVGVIGSIVDKIKN